MDELAAMMDGEWEEWGSGGATGVLRVRVGVDDHVRSICTLIPHELESVEEEDEKQMARQQQQHEHKQERRERLRRRGRDDGLNSLDLGPPSLLAWG